MTLQKKVEQVTRDTVNNYINLVGYLRKNADPCVQMGKVYGVTTNIDVDTGVVTASIQIQLPDGSIINAVPAGLSRPLALGNGVVVSNNIIIS